MRLPRVRTVLGVIGLGGLVIWTIFCSLNAVFRDFGAEGSVGGITGRLAWFCYLAPVLTFLYYCCVALNSLSRRLTVVIGVPLHMLFMIVAVLEYTKTDCGVLTSSLLLPGPVVWLYLVMHDRRAVHAAYIPPGHVRK